MKKILLDECIPRKLKDRFPEHECTAVYELGWAGKKNGDLLSLAEESGFQVFIILDRGMAYQHNVTGRGIGILLIRAKSSRLVDVAVRAPDILQAIASIESGQVVVV